MSLRYNRKHLMNMLSRDDLDRDDKQAVRFALWCIAQLYVTDGRPPEPGIPFWRLVRYTDDGCSIYQCLNCKNQWEGRDAPGWLEHHDKVDGPDDKGHGIKSNGECYHYVLKDEPVYHAAWEYCPHCGIEWDGPIRRDYGNERMLGERRKEIERLTDEARPPLGFSPDVEWWWVIQTREVWPDREKPEPWRDQSKMNPSKFGAHAAYERLGWQREQCEGLSENSMFNVKHEARIVKRSKSEMNYPPYGGPRELY